MRFVWLALLLAVVAPAEARMPVRIPQLVLAPLTWNQDVEQATKALESAKLSPRYDETRRYLAQTKDEPWVRHTSEPGLAWIPRLGWTGYAHFAWNEGTKAYRIDRMHEATQALSAASLKDELAALRDRYGEPDKQRSNTWEWKQAGTTLTVSWYRDAKTRASSLTVALRRD